MMQQNVALFIWTQEHKELLTKVILIMYLNQSIAQLYQTYKISRKRFGLDYWFSHTINISKYHTLASSSYIKLPKELDHPKKCLINIQNIDNNECFKWCLVRYLHSADHNPRRIRKVVNDLQENLILKI